MKGYRIKFIRHGITDANENGYYIGKTDLPLSAKGVDEIYNKIAEYEYSTVQRVYSSPYKRCTQTASLLFPENGIVIVDGLREMDFGDFEGKTAEELQDTPEYKKFLKGGLDNPPPNGESMREVVTRCFEALNAIVSDMMQNGFTNCAVITHGGIIMNMFSCFGIPKLSPLEFPSDFAEGYEVLVTASMWQRSDCFEIMGKFPYSDEEQYE
ncbi:MAG: histidine phosphatase family protein [Ruminococcus sp.]|nr:histidine phosphatase family protein [Ruminococcus sp.]